MSVTLAILALCLGTTSPNGSAQTGDHDHSAHHALAASDHLKFNNGKKWETDAALRQGMARIRDALSARMAVTSNDKMPAPRYQVLATEVREQISFMVQNCKLDKDADAVLHLILAELVAGADAVASGDGHSRHQGAEKMSRALEDYATYFDHPGWHGTK